MLYRFQVSLLVLLATISRQSLLRPFFAFNSLRRLHTLLSDSITREHVEDGHAANKDANHFDAPSQAEPAPQLLLAMLAIPEAPSDY